ncbi:MAG: citrate synthase [Sphaerochaetaceae bacterium]|nr:citrate synthase [Sphaerochaetaceae bacterium]
MITDKNSAHLILPGNKDVKLDVLTDNMGNKSIDIVNLRSSTGYITYDPGFMNTGSCMSSICYIDGENGILRYRGYDIEDLVENCDFIEVAHLLVKGVLPNQKERENYQQLLNKHSMLHYNMRNFFRSYPQDAHPMSILASMVASLSAFYPEMYEMDPEENIDLTVTRLLSKMRTIAAFIYRQSHGLDFVEPRWDYSYCENFLNMLFSTPVNNYQINPTYVKTLNKLLILHGDHEQNCSTTAVRLVGSSEANLYASVAAGVCALWGPKHGGANQAVMRMLKDIVDNDLSVDYVINKAKDKNDPFKLSGFGHRVYKTLDPRARIAKKMNLEMLNTNHYSDKLLDVALKLEERALSDDYFIERNLYPNIDFYTGIMFHMMGFPQEMFTVLFAMGRTPGWIAHYLEWQHEPYQKIGRPRQVYVGPDAKKVVPLKDRV